MSYSSTKCYIHPDRNAVDRCEKCKQLICIECKMKYRSFGGMDRADDIYIYCPPCYHQRDKQARTLGKIICPIFLIFFVIVIIIIIIGFISMLTAMSNFPSFP